MAAEIGAAAIGAGGQVASGVLGMIGQKKREKRAMKNQLKLMDVQFQNQKQLDKYGQELQMETWEKTNYPAQIAMLKDAGLNPGLLYGNGGSGGVTGSQGGGSAASGNAPAPQPWPLDIGQAAMMAAEITLMKAQAKKTEAEANVITNTGQKEAETRIAKMIAETTNEVTKNKLIQIETDIAEIEKQNRQYRILAEVENVIERTRQLQIQNDLTEAQFDDIVKETKFKAINTQLTNDLIEAQTKLTNTQAKTIVTAVVQRWTELGLTERRLNQEDQKIMIDSFEAEIKAEYPGVMQVAGGIVKKAYDFIENLTTKVPLPKINKIEDTIK